ncbi:TM1812 family CRISPR-associated protein [Colibacter massiliensis]|uniref:TM1812 family CRISPR-associated protein n=1 Tax=Colibacter massiliensis TaxID=1852379 RepID=UPI00266CCB30|nr:TM1812 family CRISPR-associated protein [Colibacter massiliensis]
MERQIWLTYLSTANAKVLNESSGAAYGSIEGLSGEYGKTKLTNETAIKYFLRNSDGSSYDAAKNIDKLFCFVTHDVKQGKAEQQCLKDEAGNDVPLTHYQLFKERLHQLGLLPVSSILNEEVCESDIIIPVSVDEKADVNGVINNVFDMAKVILRYADTIAKDDRLTLLIDMSGGFRTAALVMLIVARLVQYRGIQIGKVFYTQYDALNKTSRVDDVTTAFKLLDVIAGASEFTQFGSVQSFNTYFENAEEEHSLRKLLSAMDVFAESIKITSRGTFDAAAKGLRTGIKDFKNKRGSIDGRNISLRLMDLLLPQIEANYASLGAGTDERVEELGYIRWCLDHGYVQQALTLYTEYVPEYIYNLNLFDVDIDALSEKKMYDDERRSRPFLLLNVLGEEACNKEQELDALYDIREAFKAFAARLKEIKFSNNTSKEEYEAQIDSATSKLKSDIEGIMSDRECGLLHKTGCFAFIDVLGALKKGGEHIRKYRDLPYEAQAQIQKWDTTNDDKIEDIIERFDRGEITRVGPHIVPRLMNLLNVLSHKVSDSQMRNFFSWRYGPGELKDYVYCGKIANLFDKKVLILKRGIERRDVYRLVNPYLRIKGSRNDAAHALKKRVGILREADAIRREMQESLDELRAAKCKYGTKLEV